MQRYFVALAITLLTGLSLHVREAVAESPESGTFAHRTKVVALENCSSGSLRITLNVHDRTAKADLVDQLKLLSEYPLLHVVPELSEGHALVYSARLDPQCLTAECADDAGWTALQTRLLRHRDVQIRCDENSGAPGSSPAQQPEAPKQEAPKDGHGGVTGGSGGE